MENADNTTAAAAEQAVDAKKKKKEKVRSAWISFAGRIVAQIVGAIATVALGVMVLHRYTSGDTRPGPPAHELRQEPYARPADRAEPAVHVIVLTPGMLGLRDAERFAIPDRPCTARIDVPPASAAHLNHGTLLSR